MARYSFDIPRLTDGIGFIAIAMGVFGYGEIIANLGQAQGKREVFDVKLQHLYPTKEDWKLMTPPSCAAPCWAPALGILPGGGAVLSAFAAYTMERPAEAG